MHFCFASAFEETHNCQKFQRIIIRDGDGISRQTCAHLNLLTTSGPSDVSVPCIHPDRGVPPMFYVAYIHTLGYPVYIGTIPQGLFFRFQSGVIFVTLGVEMWGDFSSLSTYLSPWKMSNVNGS